MGRATKPEPGVGAGPRHGVAQGREVARAGGLIDVEVAGEGPCQALACGAHEVPHDDAGVPAAPLRPLGLEDSCAVAVDLGVPGTDQGERIDARESAGAGPGMSSPAFASRKGSSTVMLSLPMKSMIVANWAMSTVRRWVVVTPSHVCADAEASTAQGMATSTRLRRTLARPMSPMSARAITREDDEPGQEGASPPA